jgi:hypothetical protein
MTANQHKPIFSYESIKSQEKVMSGIGGRNASYTQALIRKTELNLLGNFLKIL